jgi:hypothetical protein
MATNNPPKPSQFLITTIQSGTVTPIDTVTDAASIYFGYPITFEATAYVETQYHSDETTTTPMLFDANDIQIGDWLGQASGKAYKVVDIINLIDNNNIVLKLEDTDLFILKSDTTQSGQNYPDEDQAGILFELDTEQKPILAGITQLSGQFPGVSYWVADLQSRFEYMYVDVEGVPTDVDNDKAVASNTVGNNASTGLAIEHTPFADSKVTLKINGLEASYGMSKDFYFSNDGGATARAMADIEAGDELFWNGTNAGYDLEPTDDIDIDYEAASTDL